MSGEKIVQSLCLRKKNPEGNSGLKKKIHSSKIFHTPSLRLFLMVRPLHGQPRPQGFSLKKWVGREKALASAGHVYSLNISEKLIYMQPAGLRWQKGATTENNNIANYINIFACVRFKSLRSI